MSDQKLTLRIPTEVYEAIKTRSIKNKRSINNEIEVMIERLLNTEEVLIGTGNDVAIGSPRVVNDQ